MQYALRRVVCGSVLEYARLKRISLGCVDRVRVRVCDYLMPRVRQIVS